MGGVAVVTGGGSGIGRAVTLALAAAGYAVLAAGRRPDALRETAELAAGPGEVLPVPTDVTSEDAVEALFDAAVAHGGRVDLLFNNAGVFAPPIPVDELSAAQWRAVVEVNLTGAFLCARAAFARMRRQDPIGGRIINNGSISAHTPRPRSVAYTATKHAMSGLTKSLALDGRPYRIACGQIDIGNAATEMTRPMAEGMPQADGSVRPEPTFDVAEVARTVVHLASLPLSVEVPFLTITAAAMPYLGRG